MSSLIFVLGASVALAGTGPWVVAEGQGQLYLGGEGQRIEDLSIQTADGETTVIEVDDGLTTIGAKAILTYGVLGRFEVEGTLPFYRVYANRRLQGPETVCGSLGLGACYTTEGVGIITLRGKGLLLDEFVGQPVSLALGGEVRHGGFTANDRERITNLGEGTIDTGAFASVGRIMGLGSGTWSTFLEVGGRYRFPNTTDYVPAAGDPEPVPGTEWFASTEVLFNPVFSFSIGPEVQGLWRPGGFDWYELDLADVDRLSALRIGLVRTGLKALVRNEAGAGFSVSAARTVYAFNNPSNATVISMGISFPALSRKQGS